MPRRASLAMQRLRTWLSWAGFLIFLAGSYRLWQLRYAWPRRAGDPVSHAILEALFIIIAGLYLNSKAR